MDNIGLWVREVCHESVFDGQEAEVGFGRHLFFSDGGGGWRLVLDGLCRGADYF